MARYVAWTSLVICLFASPPLQAQPAAPPVRVLCHDYKELVRQLGSRYEEVPVSFGLQNNGHLLQVFASPKTGSWTILSVAPDGTGCVLAVGKGWEILPIPSSDPPA
ncbi:MAG: hypothetical protein RMK73_10370 [Geminicoccaceae bacterium]|nr:hypothetical protein [Geminicoccaceae bacterium]MDW8126118.1 hypothetical protein [Geminicoccaceae bacterium]MDW8341874.1 hypothetical protein [Geminicoccaceae bacterium]